MRRAQNIFMPKYINCNAITLADIEKIIYLKEMTTK